MIPSQKQSELLRLVIASGGYMSHGETSLNKFCDDHGDAVDTFNECHAAGWLKTFHNGDESTVQITTAGRVIITAEDIF